MVKVVRFLIVSSLEAEVYLGMNFWTEFVIAPMMLAELSTNSSSFEIDVETKKLVLTIQQKHQLEEVINMVSSYNNLGLGRSTVMEFKINTGDASPIKQRFYPISPAVQEPLYDLLDRMLAEDIIEESTECS